MARIKCTCCKCTFVDYPDFAIPFKRYVLTDIILLLDIYLTYDAMSYQCVVIDDEQNILHERSEEDSEENLKPKLEQCFHHTTVWHWMTCIGMMSQMTQVAKRLIEEREPENPLLTYQPAIHPKKYRSPERKLILENAMSLIRVFYEFIRIFGYSFSLSLPMTGIFLSVLPKDFFFSFGDLFFTHPLFPYLAIVTAFT